MEKSTTKEQRSIMLHAIGGKAVDKPFRNHFCGSEDDKDWLKLIEMGFATLGSKSPISPDTVYHVTQEGIDHIKV